MHSLTNETLDKIEAVHSKRLLRDKIEAQLDRLRAEANSIDREIDIAKLSVQSDLKLASQRDGVSYSVESFLVALSVLRERREG